MTREQIFGVVKRSICEILSDVREQDIHLGSSLKDLGANSVDRAEIAFQSIANLRLKMSLMEIGTARNLSDLVELLYAMQPAEQASAESASRG